MRKIQASDVKPRRDELVLQAICSGAERGDKFRATDRRACARNYVCSWHRDMSDLTVPSGARLAITKVGRLSPASISAPCEAQSCKVPSALVA